MNNIMLLGFLKKHFKHRWDNRGEVRKPNGLMCILKYFNLQSIRTTSNVFTCCSNAMCSHFSFAAYLHINPYILPPISHNREPGLPVGVFGVTILQLLVFVQTLQASLKQHRWSKETKWINIQDLTLISCTFRPVHVVLNLSTHI